MFTHKINKFFSATVSALAIILTTVPANALPGQNINTVIKWAKTKSQLPTLTYNSEAYGYGGTKKNLYFYANVTSRDGIVNKEGITISGDSSLKFTTKNPLAVRLLKNIYNFNIANDFQNSRYVIKIGRDHFYRGKFFGYITAMVEDGSAFQIVELSKLQAEINNAKYCQTYECDL